MHLEMNDRRLAVLALQSVNRRIKCLSAFTSNGRLCLNLCVEIGPSFGVSLNNACQLIIYSNM